jgi:elongation factor Ts
MTQIKTTEISKLRKATGAGIMDCKKALQEVNGNFEKAIEIIRKKGQAIATKRADRETGEGVVLAKVTSDSSRGVIVVLNCETDFVAKNEDFINFVQTILDKAIEENPSNLAELKKLKIDGVTIANEVINRMGIIGEKLDLTSFDRIEASKVISYVHPGNKLATLVGLEPGNVEQQVGKDVAMQVAAMNPEAIDRDGVKQERIDEEIEIGKEQARREGKPENLLDKIARGKLEKFFKENTLMNQDFIKDNKKSIKQYLKEINPNIKVTAFKRYSLRD